MEMPTGVQMSESTFDLVTDPERFRELVYDSKRTREQIEVWVKPWAFGQHCLVGEVNVGGSESGECDVEAHTYICIEP